MNESDALRALQAVDFQWTVHVDSVWTDTPYHIPALHSSIADELLYELDELKKKQSCSSPLGWVVTGPGGSGKTHLLRTLRKATAARNAGFVLVDMTGVHNFWETVLLAYLESLQKPYISGKPQYYHLLEHLLNTVSRKRAGRQHLEIMAALPEKRTIPIVDGIIKLLAKHNPSAILQYQDTIRALVLLNSNDLFIQNIGYSWLLGLGIENHDKKKYGFQAARKRPQDIVKALSWLMSLKNPVILALDQMDAIVTQHHLASGPHVTEHALDEQKVSRAIIEGIAGGLSALRDLTCRTLIVSSCLESTWEIIKETLSTNADRYNPAIILQKIGKHKIAQRIVESRLSAAYKKKGFLPEYASWPFKPEAFKIAEGMLPRQVLQNCEKYRKKCLKDKLITECDHISFPDHGNRPAGKHENYAQLNRTYQMYRRLADPAALLNETKEDTEFSGLLEAACRCFKKELTLPDNIDMVVDQDFAGGKSYSFLHARMRLIYREEGDREEHFCLRALLKTHPIAYQNRLKAAMTTSGIDRNLKFRRLVIIRNQEIPGGTQTKLLTHKFNLAGGSFARLTDDEVRTMRALQELEKQNDPQFEAWLKSCKPVSKLQFMRALAPDLCKNDIAREIKASSQETKIKSVEKNKKDAPSEETNHQKTKIKPDEAKISPLKDTLPIGRRLIGSKARETIFLPLQDLSKHTVILAGSGSGKTVLVRRLAEEAALSGIPSVVIDSANDLALLGDAWPEPPSVWQAQDTVKAQKYHQQTEVIIWTPGIEKGNPLKLEPLPDLAALKHDADELEQAVGMARDALQGIVAPGASQKAQKKRGVLHAVLEYSAHHGQSGLTDFIELLADLPSDAGGGITNAAKLALEMADNLRAQMQTDILLKQHGAALDPAKLFGVHDLNQKAASSQTRISVINFAGLPAIASQQQFLNQLAMTLFTWIKKNPASPDSPLRGLLIIDEAKDFIPAGKSAPCKDSMLRLTAQARKYGLGLIFATQAPKSIDHNIVANCNTHFYGQANSPAAIAVVQEQIRLRGGTGKDVPRLGAGKFYFYSAKTGPPFKIIAPLCLSFHPLTPPPEEKIIRRACKTR